MIKNILLRVEFAQILLLHYKHAITCTNSAYKDILIQLSSLRVFRLALEVSSPTL